MIRLLRLLFRRPDACRIDLGACFCACERCLMRWRECGGGCV